MFTDRKLKEYNEREERFRLAVEEATSNKSASINSIANKYRVSRTTLSRRIHGFKNTRNSHEKQQKFTNEEENLIVSQITEILRSSDHVPPKREILVICENLLKDKYKDRAPVEGENFFKVGKNWIDRFLERHNDKLMINAETTLSEYYKSEFLQRKKLRGDRGFKTDSSNTPTEDGYSQQPPLQSYNSSESIHQLDQAPAPRLPYQSHSDPFIYQNVEQSVPLNSHGGYSSNQQPSYGQDWQYSSLPHKQPGVPGYQHLQTNPHQHQQYSYGSIPAPYLQYQQQQQQSQTHTQTQAQQPQQPQQQTQTQQSQQPQKSYIYANTQVAPKASTTPVVPTYEQQQQAQAQAASQNQGHSFQQGQNFNGYQFSQGYQSTTNVNSELSIPEASSQSVQPLSPDLLEFYQGQRFQYEAVRQRIIKELGKEIVDTNSILKLVNLSFNQIERDLASSGNNYGSIHNY